MPVSRVVLHCRITICGGLAMLWQRSGRAKWLINAMY